MANYIAIQRSTHLKAGYSQSIDFGFASHMPTAPLLQAELPHAIQHMACAFQISNPSSGEEKFELMGIQSILPNKNLFVMPDGRWIGGYKPAFYRARPFALMMNKESKEIELNIDQDHIIEAPSEDQPKLFDETGTLTPKIRETVEFLGHSLRNREKTLALCSELQEADLLKPWDIKFSSSHDGETQIRSLQGLYHIDIKTLKNLESNTLSKLNKSGALELAYSQILSEPRINSLSTLVSVHQKLEAQQTKNKVASEVDLDDLFSDKDELFSF